MTAPSHAEERRGSSNPRPAQRFCAEDSLAIGDPLVGSAAHAERNLLISWPRPKWLRSLRQAKDMPEAVRERLGALAEAGRRVNLIHRRGEDAELHRIFLMPECREYRVPREELEAFLAAFADDAALDAWAVGKVTRPLILCCTHGKKDKCCAKFGYATYQAIAGAVARDERPFEVWESTHLGGCRLATSALVLPALRKYGRITPAEVPGLLEAEGEDRPYLPCYRGDSRLTPVEQCAQVAALEWLAARGHHARASVEDALIDDDGDDDGSRRRLPVRWQAGEQEGRLVVSCLESELIRHDTCSDADAGPPTPSRVWRATRID
ncbi:sucrase ferredoxin [Halomonas borealis]|uniref:sucrase ferredoxin n=1 Tax=Halomonas borealis TaxID=2508710 RepID=UPI00109F4366|nr:sucrase ferredoxin [Halomonas borealis]